MIRGIVVSDKDELTHVPVDFKAPVKAIIINPDGHAYCKVTFD
jgi:hypothetical protein